VLGRRVDRVLLTTVTFVPSAFDVAEGDPRFGGGRSWRWMRGGAGDGDSGGSCWMRRGWRALEALANEGKRQDKL